MDFELPEELAEVQKLARDFSAHPTIVADCEKRIAEIKTDAERRARADARYAEPLTVADLARTVAGGRDLHQRGAGSVCQRGRKNAANTRS